MTASLLSPDALEAALKAIGAERYHNLHPFHKLLHGGKLNRGQVQAWALNRYYYQSRIPAKDATLQARLPTAELRRAMPISRWPMSRNTRARSRSRRAC